MGDAGESKYKVTLDELVASARIKPEDQVESVDADEHEPFDAHQPQPDARWFAAGG